MLLYRVLCAFLLAWAVGWSLGQEQAAALLETVPEMAVLGPVAGAFVGFISLSKRQGWGAVVGTGLFLGWAATFYTLYFLVAAFAVALMGLLSAVLRRRRHSREPQTESA